MQNLRGAQKLAAVILAWLLSTQSSLADPLHKFGNDGAYRHEHSGWNFPRHIGGLELIAAAWVVTIRTTAQATDTQAATALDEFVRALRWDTLGTDEGNLHGATE